MTKQIAFWVVFPFRVFLLLLILPFILGSTFSFWLTAHPEISQEYWEVQKRRIKDYLFKMENF